MELNTIYLEDCLHFSKKLPNDFVDLLITSPPYSDLKDYGHNDGIISPDEYVDWFLPKAQEFYRILKPSGSFVLNINDKVVNGERHLYVYDLVIALKRVIGFKFFERMYWIKVSSPVNPKTRPSDWTEYLFWFTKTDNNKYNIVRRPHSEGTMKRSKCKYGASNSYTGSKPGLKISADGASPNNILTLSNHTTLPNNFRHPAKFPVGIPEFFIKACTDEGDLVYDPFMGSGTTAVVSKQLNRNFIGTELNSAYIEVSNQRLSLLSSDIKEESNLYFSTLLF
jgi:site-specific DNA-methyltransferase (adenine-specific)